MINKIFHFIKSPLARIEKRSGIPRAFLANYGRGLGQLQKSDRGFNVFEELRYETGVHPANFIDFQCGFAAHHLSRLNPQKILDIGSYRHFILGMLSHYCITSVDFRKRQPISDNETVITCDARGLDFHNNEFDAVISLCTLEHLGLGRYGEEIDPEADRKAFKEMVRVLKPGGHLIFTTTITRGRPTIAFNAHRIYSYDMLKKLCEDLIRVEERFYSYKMKGFCPLDEVTIKPKACDIYCGCWKKK